MQILITGASGFIGSALVSFLETKGHQVGRLTRKEPPPNLENFDAVVHLAGENIFGRWTKTKKDKILNSRVKGTKLLCETLAKLKQPPNVLISASAIGYYGNRGDEILNEESAPGSDFLAQVCREWEGATKTAKDKGIRVVNLRFGIVLGKEGGALKQMLLPFKLGLGGKMGNGHQWMSWIALDDLLNVILFAIEKENLQGPVNAVSPNAVTNAEFTKALGRALNRPTIFPLPAFAAKLVFGEMAEALLLSSARVLPNKLIDTGFQFRYPEIDSAFEKLFKQA